MNLTGHIKSEMAPNAIDKIALDESYYVLGN